MCRLSKYVEERERERDRERERVEWMVIIKKVR